MYEIFTTVPLCSLYVIIGIYTTIAVLMAIAPETHSFLTGGNKHDTYCIIGSDPPWMKYILLAMLNFSLWPLILLYLLTVNRMSISINK